MAKRNGEDVGKRTDKGILLGSGLIGGEGLMGVAVAVYAVIRGAKPEGFQPAWLERWDMLLAAAVFVLMCWWMVRLTRLSKAEREESGS
jgi:uncharacterized membrane protein YhdT